MYKITTNYGDYAGNALRVPFHWRYAKLVQQFYHFGSVIVLGILCMIAGIVGLSFGCTGYPIALLLLIFPIFCGLFSWWIYVQPSNQYDDDNLYVRYYCELDKQTKKRLKKSAKFINKNRENNEALAVWIELMQTANSTKNEKVKSQVAPVFMKDALIDFKSEAEVQDIIKTFPKVG